MRLRLLTRAGLLLTITACGYQGLVVHDFGATTKCPNDRVTVIAHPEIAGHRIDPDRFAFHAPPSILADPNLLRVWKEGPGAPHAESFMWDGRTIYEANGCGTTKWYACETETTNGQLRRRSNTSDECYEGTPPGPP